MSKPSAAFALPLDERPGAALQDKPDLFVERDVVASGEPAAEALLPGLSLILDEVGPALEAAQIAFADLNLARKQGNLALMKAAATRLVSLTNHVNRTVQACRPVERKNDH